MATVTRFEWTFLGIFGALTAALIVGWRLDLVGDSAAAVAACSTIIWIAWIIWRPRLGRHTTIERDSLGAPVVKSADELSEQAA